jgi:hypothetical protein
VLAVQRRLLGLGNRAGNGRGDGLAERGVLDKRKKGKQTLFLAPSDLSARLLELEKEAGA